MPEHQRPGLAGLRREWVDGQGRRLGDPFPEHRRSKVNPQIFGTSEEAYTLFSTNPEQSTSFGSGDASLRFVRGGFVQPVDVDFFKSYPDIFDTIKDQACDTVDGVH